MRCPVDGCTGKLGVTHTRPAGPPGALIVRRGRTCNVCGYKISTQESETTRRTKVVPENVRLAVAVLLAQGETATYIARHYPVTLLYVRKLRIYLEDIVRTAANDPESETNPEPAPIA